MLNLRESKLIYALDFNARMPLSSLAKVLNTSKQMTKYYLDNLLKKKVIEGFYTDINPSKIGLQIYLVYFNLHHITPNKEKELINHLSSQKSIGVNLSLNGKWDHCIGIWAESIFHFRNYYNEIMKDYEIYVRNKTVMIETDFFYFKPKQIMSKANDKEISMHGSTDTVKVDYIDRIILSNLSENARMSLVELGEKTRLTPNAVKVRIKNLEKSKVILGYRVMINYQLLGFLHYRVFLHMEGVEESTESKIIKFLKEHKAVISATKTIGYCDLEFRAVVKDIHEFYSLMEELRGKFPDEIKDYEPIIYYKFHETLNYFPFQL